VVVLLHQLTAAIYLIAGVIAGLGVALPAPRLGRASLALLTAGAVAHALCFGALHSGETTPPLTELPAAVSFMAWVGTVFFLILARRAKLVGLVTLVAPLAFISVFVAGLRLRQAAPVVESAGGSWEHAHVLLASAGLAMLGLAGLAGVFYLTEHRRLKSKRPLRRRLKLPSLEALDRVNAVALGVGFPLLTLGVVTGVFYVEQQTGHIWSGTAHEIWSVMAWLVYAVVAIARFTTRQGARQAAAVAIGGFAFLLFAVIGLEILA
jgi:ABC-type transport system involved in cytochrome c biogenesis permease subunit